jgi:molecular chaperone GrpE
MVTTYNMVKKEKFIRLFADFENYKKRIQKERIELFKTAHQEVIISLIPILDDFSRCLLELKKSTDKKLIEGVELIRDKFFRILKDQGIDEINTKIGDIFDTDLHEAVTQIISPNDYLKGKIIHIVDSGYKLNNKVIRHTKVIVGK